MIEQHHFLPFKVTNIVALSAKQYSELTINKIQYMNLITNKQDETTQTIFKNLIKFKVDHT
jgi:hypothetical protein